MLTNRLMEDHSNSIEKPKEQPSPKRIRMTNSDIDVLFACIDDKADEGAGDHTSDLEESIKDEIKRYRRLPKEELVTAEMQYTCPLQWWKKREVLFK